MSYFYNNRLNKHKCLCLLLKIRWRNELPVILGFFNDIFGHFYLLIFFFFSWPVDWNLNYYEIVWEKKQKPSNRSGVSGLEEKTVKKDGGGDEDKAALQEQRH